MSKPRKDEPLKMPRYHGGDEALKKFIADHLKYPTDALKGKVEGEVEVSYDVNGLGLISKIKILKSLGHGCDEEVVRLVKMLKFEKAYNKGRSVTSHKKLKVDFKLPVQKKEQKVQYQITPKIKILKKETSKPQTYNYTININ